MKAPLKKKKTKDLCRHVRKQGNAEMLLNVEAAGICVGRENVRQNSSRKDSSTEENREKNARRAQKVCFGAFKRRKPKT